MRIPFSRSIRAECLFWSILTSHLPNICPCCCCCCWAGLPGAVGCSSARASVAVASRCGVRVKVILVLVFLRAGRTRECKWPHGPGGHLMPHVVARQGRLGQGGSIPSLPQVRVLGTPTSQNLPVFRGLYFVQLIYLCFVFPHAIRVAACDICQRERDLKLIPSPALLYLHRA